MKIPRCYRGQTLLSLMISLSLSAFLLLVILQFYQHSQQQHREMLLRLQLQTETQRVIQLMAKDIRRSGFRAVSDSVVQDNFALFEQSNGENLVITQGNNAAEQSCVLFFYDLDESGCLGKKRKNPACMQHDQNMTEEIERELFGYRLNQDMLETRLSYKNAVNASCQKADCQTYLQQPACNGGGWADLLDGNEYMVLSLRFSWLAEKQGVQIDLSTASKAFPQLQYETRAVVPLLNARTE